MDPNFWQQRWERNQIRFHEGQANALLVKHFASLALPPNRRFFVPLCGKTRDIAWLLSQGHAVVGAELSELAIRQLFAELALEPKIASLGKLLHYSAANIDIFVGDIFDLSRDDIGAVDAIYDRAALIALPSDLRDRYSAHLVKITDAAPQLLICYEYDQTLRNGPPFSVDGAEVARLYGTDYTLNLLERMDLDVEKGDPPEHDAVWLLR